MVQTCLKIAMLAAHGGSNSNVLPLGGGAAVCERLLQAWKDVEGIELTLIVPGPVKTDRNYAGNTKQANPDKKSEPGNNSSKPENSRDIDGTQSHPLDGVPLPKPIGWSERDYAQRGKDSTEADEAKDEENTAQGPASRELVALSEISLLTVIRIPVLKCGESPCKMSTMRYASFCRQFEKAATQKVLELKPDVVLTHDICEGPSFVLLHKAGIPCVPIFHVDVTDFFCRMYLPKMMLHWQPDKAFEMWKKIRKLPFVPDALRLVFDKQAAAVKLCPKLIVPSQGMKDIMLSTYGHSESLEKRIEVIPWGAPVPQFTHAQIEDAIPQINSEFNLHPNDPVLVTLSRISPEKAQNKLLEALSWGEQFGGIPDHLTVLICGEPSFMEGRRFFAKLKAAAADFRKIRVIFPGHVGGLKKAAIMSRATIFISTSRHESYGLTTMEAMSEGTPVIALDTPGARQTIAPQTGIIVSSQEPTALSLWQAIHSVLSNSDYRRILGEHAKRWAERENFIEAAQRILDVIEDAAEP